MFDLASSKNLDDLFPPITATLHVRQILPNGAVGLDQPLSQGTSEGAAIRSRIGNKNPRAIHYTRHALRDLRRLGNKDGHPFEELGQHLLGD